MALSSCYGISRSVAQRTAAQPARHEHDKKPRLPGNQALLRSGSAHARLRVSQPNEPAEREADAMAERIVARQPEAADVSVDGGGERIDRACAECEDELDDGATIARQADDEDSAASEAGQEAAETDDEEEDIETMNDDSVLARKAEADGGGASVSAGVVPQESGSALAPGVRQAMESGFGAGLGHVRVHTGAAAAQSATLLRARAYTVGNHVYFGAGQYAPHSRAGKRLLAHELTHVLQQGRGQARRLQRDDKDKPAKADDAGKDKPAQRTITRIDVDLSKQSMTITWSDASTEDHVISSGMGAKGTAGDPCATQKEVNCTPTGTFKIGYKRGADHKNSKGDAMAWFVELTGDEVINGRGIGFHNSQTADGTPRSHGCMRVGKGEDATKFARKINEGVTADTTVVVGGKAPTKAYGTPPKKKAAPKNPPAKKKK